MVDVGDLPMGPYSEMLNNPMVCPESQPAFGQTMIMMMIVVMIMMMLMLINMVWLLVPWGGRFTHLL
jgi:flagellar biogenesis protein FliO